MKKRALKRSYKSMTRLLITVPKRLPANVLATVDKVRKSGIAVVFITHNVRHALAVGDRFTVLNRGKTLGTAKRGEISPEELQDLMAGGMEMATLEGSLGGTV